MALVQGGKEGAVVFVFIISFLASIYCFICNQ